jgi:6-pyruvoyltetrahydropterin/6-carboxytetrahydropterin synthase
MVYITRKVDFCASHRLHNPELSQEENEQLYGCCNNPNGHGHNYVLEVTVKGSIDPRTGMVMNLKELKEIITREIVDRVDHLNFNVDVNFLQGVIPTSENIIVAFWRILDRALEGRCRLHEMKLWETPSNMVVYRGEGAA